MTEAAAEGARDGPGGGVRGPGPRFPPAPLTSIGIFVLLPILGIAFASLRPAASTWGWDESMHAELPAARMALALRAADVGGFFEALLACEQYPFGYPLILALVQFLGGISEALCRATGAAVFGLTLAGTALLSNGSRQPMRGGIAFVFAASSPLLFAFGSTLFLEVPFVCVSVFALRAFLRRERLAGLWLAAAFFTKFNYGALLALGLALDEGFRIVAAARRGSAREHLRESARLWAPFVLALLWWFLLPLPGGLGTGASHRAAFLGFLGGNQEMAPVAWSTRALYFAGYLHASPLAALLALIGLAVSLTRLSEASVRTVWIVFLATAVSIALHPFHLERFQLAACVPLWWLAGVGWSTVLARFRAGVITVLFLAALFGGGLFGPAQTAWLADRFGVLPGDPGPRAYAESVFEGWSGRFSERVVPTAGLAKSEVRAILDLVAGSPGSPGPIGSIDSGERVAWLGASSEMSPACLHLGLLARGGDVARFRADAHLPFDVTPAPGMPLPEWDTEELGEWADGFDVIVLTDPPDLKGRADRDELQTRFHRPLVETLGWSATHLGAVTIERPPGEPHEVSIYACRKP